MSLKILLNRRFFFTAYLNYIDKIKVGKRINGKAKTLSCLCLHFFRGMFYSLLHINRVFQKFCAKVERDKNYLWVRETCGIQINIQRRRKCCMTPTKK